MSLTVDSYYPSLLVKTGSCINELCQTLNVTDVVLLTVGQKKEENEGGVHPLGISLPLRSCDHCDYICLGEEL